ncbi:MAG: ABC transporter permease, partial [Burkholderiaceae bacterium]
MTARDIKAFWPDLARNPVLWLATLLVASQVLLSLLAGVVAPYDPVAQAVESRLAAPSPEFLLGTDKLGRDVLSRIIHGYQSSLAIAFSAVLLALLVG